MGRLIEESNVIEIAEKCTFTDESERRRFLDFVKYCVKETKTAYDVDKVVKGIHNFKCQKCRNILGIAGADEYCERQHCQVYQICKIVRKGGVE